MRLGSLTMRSGEPLNDFMYRFHTEMENGVASGLPPMPVATQRVVFLRAIQKRPALKEFADRAFDADRARARQAEPGEVIAPEPMERLFAA